VLDDETNTGVPNISVRIAKTDLHTITDTNGKFSFSVPEDIVNTFKTLDFIPNFVSDADSGSLMGVSVDAKTLSKPVTIYRSLPETIINVDRHAAFTGEIMLTTKKRKHWYSLFSSRKTK